MALMMPFPSARIWVEYDGRKIYVYKKKNKKQKKKEAVN